MKFYVFVHRQRANREHKGRGRERIEIFWRSPPYAGKRWAIFASEQALHIAGEDGKLVWKPAVVADRLWQTRGWKGGGESMEDTWSCRKSMGWLPAAAVTCGFSLMVVFLLEPLLSTNEFLLWVGQDARIPRVDESNSYRRADRKNPGEPALEVSPPARNRSSGSVDLEKLKNTRIG